MSGLTLAAKLPSKLLYKLDGYNSRARMVLEAEVKLKKWGSSIGLVLPKKALEKEHLKAGQTVKVLIIKQGNPLKETFGTLTFKKSTEQMMREIDKELWND